MSEVPAPRAIAAAICTYNRHDLLEEAVASVLAQALEPDAFEILVVDNSPPGPQRAAAAERYAGHPRVRYLTEDTPGLSNARNVAIRETSAPLVAFMDDDAVARPDWLAEVLRAFRTFGEDAGVVGGKVCPIWGAERPAWLPDDLLGALTVVDWGGELRAASPTEWVAGANYSVRSEAVRAVGGFPTSLGRIGESILLSNEDARMVKALRDQGLQTIWAPDAIVDHRVDPRRLDQTWLRSRMAWQAVSDLLADARPEPDAERHWKNVTRFFSTLPPALRTPRGFFSEADDPALFSQQVRALYSMTRLALLGWHLPND
jgi:GT2 family glycosyltransferase